MTGWWAPWYGRPLRVLYSMQQTQEKENSIPEQLNYNYALNRVQNSPLKKLEQPSANRYKDGD